MSELTPYAQGVLTGVGVSLFVVLLLILAAGVLAVVQGRNSGVRR